jgi:hypothetical protein
MGLHERTENDFVVRIVGKRLLGDRRRRAVVTVSDRRVDGDAPGVSDRRSRRGACRLGPRPILVGKQWSTGKSERGARSRPGHTDSPTVERSGSHCAQAGELVGVEPVGAERITGIAPRDPLGAHNPTQPQHQHPDLIGRSSRLLVTPQHLGEAGQREQLQQRPPLAAAELAFGQPFDLEAAEHAHPHASSLPPHRTDAQTFPVVAHSLDPTGESRTRRSPHPCAPVEPNPRPRRSLGRRAGRAAS